MSNLKLKQAIAEIKAILEKHDIAGAVVIHTPGHAEFLLQVDPSYSCCKIEDGQIRVKALQRNFPSIEAWRKCTRDTSNMLHLLSRAMGGTALDIMQISDKVDRATNSIHHNPHFFKDKN